MAMTDHQHTRLYKGHEVGYVRDGRNYVPIVDGVSLKHQRAGTAAEALGLARAAISTRHGKQ